MAWRTMFCTLYLSEPWRSCKPNKFHSCSSFMSLHPSSVNKAWNFPNARRTQALNCSNKSRDDDGKSADEAAQKAIKEVSKTKVRVGKTTYRVFGSRVTGDATKEWLELDKKVNSYPSLRKFIAIGTGGHDFVHRMIVSVESVIQKPIPWDQVRQRVSKGGRYVSVNIGPVEVVSGKQVQAVYCAMRRDDRMKFFL